MSIRNLFKISQNERLKFCSHIIDSSTPRTDFYFLVVLSTLIVALGIFADNVILAIGGMLVTPILSPILALSLGIVINDGRVILRSLRIVSVSFIYAFFVALILGLISSVNLREIYLIKMMEPSYLIFFIAIVAGLAASYTWVKPTLNQTLPGIAITVTLIPPLTAVGLSVADRDWLVFENILTVLLLNFFGIVIASLIVFSLMDFYKAKKKVIEEVKEEEREIKKEKNNNK